MTATELKRLEAEDTPPEDTGAPLLAGAPRTQTFRRPDFSARARKLTAAERGTATHRILQYLHFADARTPEGIRAQVETLTARGELTGREAQAVDTASLLRLGQTPLGAQLAAAEAAGTLRREFRFSLLCPAETFFPGAGDEQVLLQGVVDAWFETKDGLVIVDYKDDATAFNGQKKGTIVGKGVVNNKMSNYLMQMLEKNGVKTDYVEELNDRETVLKKVEIVPLEVIVRNKAAGSFSKRLGVAEGTELKCPILEFCYKDDALGDPMVNEYHVLAMGYATREELDTITSMTFRINDLLKEFFAKTGVELIDFKLEFGRCDGEILLADEISPDTCRFWDIKTHEKLDKDRFRRDMGGVEEAYAEMMKRVGLA